LLGFFEKKPTKNVTSKEKYQHTCCRISRERTLALWAILKA